MGTKNNPGPFNCYDSAHPDEPIFVLKASDPVAAIMVRFWAGVRRLISYALLNHDWSKEQSRLNEAEQCAKTMDEWRKLKGLKTYKYIKPSFNRKKSGVIEVTTEESENN